MARILQDYPEIALKPEDLAGKADFVRIFGRSGPVHIEIGSGRAGFLLSQATAQPDIDFLGIEWAGRYYRYSVDRIGRWGLSNVRIIRTDAAVFLTDFVPDGSIDCFHIYFPDPWPKRRHHKRRFFCSANVEQLLRCLKSGGVIQFATDHAGYFEQVRKVIAGQDGRLEKIEFIPPAGAGQGCKVGTNFELKYLKEQKPIYTIAVRKI